MERFSPLFRHMFDWNLYLETIVQFIYSDTQISWLTKVFNAKP